MEGLEIQSQFIWVMSMYISTVRYLCWPEQPGNDGLTCARLNSVNRSDRGAGRYQKNLRFRLDPETRQPDNNTGSVVWEKHSGRQGRRRAAAYVLLQIWWAVR